MLWSLFKIILFVVLIGAATVGATYLLETDGGIRIDIGAQEFGRSHDTGAAERRQDRATDAERAAQAKARAIRRELAARQHAERMETRGD